jgi:hypothetical protein
MNWRIVVMPYPKNLIVYASEVEIGHGKMNVGVIER